MTITAISQARTVPVSEDLTTEELRLSILRGYETMKRVDKKIKEGDTFALGEWCVLNADDEAEKATATPAVASYLVLAGTDRFDAAATGQVTLAMNSNIIAKTQQFDPGPTYTVGMALTVKLVSGVGVLTERSGSEPIFARVHSILQVGDGVLVYETVSN